MSVISTHLMGLIVSRRVHDLECTDSIWGAESQSQGHGHPCVGAMLIFSVSFRI